MSAMFDGDFDVSSSAAPRMSMAISDVPSGRKTVGEEMLIFKDRVHELEDQLADDRAAASTLKRKLEGEFSAQQQDIDRERSVYSCDIRQRTKERDEARQQYMHLQNSSQKQERVLRTKLMNADEEVKIFKAKLQKDQGDRAVTNCLKQLDEMRRQFMRETTTQVQFKNEQLEKQMVRERVDFNSQLSQLRERENKLKSQQEKAKVQVVLDQRRMELEKGNEKLAARLQRQKDELAQAHATATALRKQLQSGEGGRVRELEDQLRAAKAQGAADRSARDGKADSEARRLQGRVTELETEVRKMRQLRADEASEGNGRLQKLREQLKRAEELCRDYKEQHERVIDAQSRGVFGDEAQWAAFARQENNKKRPRTGGAK